MLESICVTEKLHWPEVELTRKSMLNINHKLYSDHGKSVPELSKVILRNTFITGTSSYNVLLQTKEKKQHLQKQSRHGQEKKTLKVSKASTAFHTKDNYKKKSCLQSSDGLFARRKSSSCLYSTKPSIMRCSQSISIRGSHLGLLHRPKTGLKRRQGISNVKKEKETALSKPETNEGGTRKKCCILNAIKPSNVEREKIKFFKSEFTYNPQFEYTTPARPGVLEKYSHASDRFLQQAINIMLRALKKYGSYEKFEQATGGSLVPKKQIRYQVRKYMEREGCLGEIVVHLSEDLLSRASMTVVNGCPTLTINISTAREQWLEGMLKHEIGTHYFRGMNNSQQPWNTSNGRKKYGLKPVNPTEEGLASIHSVLFRKDPFLWRAALLYYTVYQASCMSFVELFKDVGQFVKDPNTRWDYCVRAKRGWADTSQPGCFSKDQVYLDGILQILKHRESIDFCLLTSMGKISYEDVDRLKDFAVLENARIPLFLQDKDRYMRYLEKIMQVNALNDAELAMIID
ncbi:hypothetical protein GDO86_011539 [Hymenochirus boettgeri]|uniref:KIAA0895 n=1 Tax=Hymenochirus boettgeri TaxID=247094 RepID=A0A8T2JGZ3_9PIPI|nr:hypothetical protein GDO86_011539 [Hymenochirus boettgeri]